MFKEALQSAIKIIFLRQTKASAYLTGLSLKQDCEASNLLTKEFKLTNKTLLAAPRAETT